MGKYGSLAEALQAACEKQGKPAGEVQQLVLDGSCRAPAVEVRLRGWRAWAATGVQARIGARGPVQRLQQCRTARQNSAGWEAQLPSVAARRRSRAGSTLRPQRALRPVCWAQQQQQLPCRNVQLLQRRHLP